VPYARGVTRELIARLAWVIGSAAVAFLAILGAMLPDSVRIVGARVSSFV